MINSLDVLAILIAPLLLGTATAWSFRKLPDAGAVIGIWVAFSSCYWFRLALEDWMLVEAKSAGAIVSCLKSALGQLAAPTTGLMWLPLATFVVLLISLVIGFVLNRNDEEGKSTTEAFRRSSIQTNVFIILILLSFCFVVIGSMLWTSIYLTDKYSASQHVGFVLIPAIAVAITWWLGVRRKATEDSISGIFSLAAIIVSTITLLGTAGSIQYALYTGGAMTFPLILALHYRQTGRLVSQSAGIIAFAMGIPVALGFFFAEVTWFEGLSGFTSFALLMCLWPSRNTTAMQRWLMTILPPFPILVAAVLGVVDFVTEINITPDSNPYSNL